MATKMVVGFPRWTPKFTFSGGSFQAAYPVTNLGVLPLANVARTTNLLAASTQFLATADKPRRIGLLALVRHSLSITAQWRVRIYSDTAATALLYDSGFIDVWPVVYPYAQLEWEDDTYWTGKYTADDLAGYAWTRPLYLNAQYIAGAIRIEITDAANTNGFIDIGAVEIAGGFVAATNFSRSSQFGFRFRTASQEALGGTKYFDRRDKVRVMRGSIDADARDEAMARWFELLRQFDLDIPWFWFPHPDETVHWLRTAYLVRCLDPGLFGYVAGNQNSVPFSVEEVL